MVLNFTRKTYATSILFRTSIRACMRRLRDDLGRPIKSEEAICNTLKINIYDYNFIQMYTVIVNKR